MNWRIDEIFAKKPMHDLAWCSLPASRQTNTHFCKRFRGEREGSEFEYFQREAAVATRLRHPNFRGLTAAELDVEYPILVFPRISGRLLPAWLNAQTQMAAQPVIFWIVRQVLESLEALHRLGYVHGAIGPEHVMVVEGDRVILLGLGCAEEVGQWTCLPRVQSAYDAPERLASEFEVSSAQDIYSAGILLVNLLGLGSTQAPIVDAMTAVEPNARPQAGELVKLFLALERELFGQHIRVSDRFQAKAA
jgi:eukaryotic-like serine/threonine-protein kinase